MEEASESVQQLILETLERQGSISNTNTLCIGGKIIDQQLVLGILKRLAGHEVFPSIIVTGVLLVFFPPKKDG